MLQINKHKYVHHLDKASNNVISKHFVNETHNEIELTLYVAGREGIKLNTYGSRILRIDSGGNATIPIDDLRNSFVQGIRIRTSDHTESMSLQRGTHEANSPLYTLLNQHDTFRIGADKHSFAIEPVPEES